MNQDKLQEVNEWFSTWIQKIPNEQKDQIVEVLDHLMFYLSNFFQQRERLQEMENKILLEARLFNEDISTIEEMGQLSLQQLEYIEDKSKTKYLTYSLVEGGIAGFGHPLLVLFDFPALLSINLKLVHSIASTYGYSLKYPPEQVLALQVLHSATLSGMDIEEKIDWIMEGQWRDEDNDLYLMKEDTVIQPKWLETLAKQWIKALVLYGMGKNSKKSFPILGVALGANLNYQFTKNVAQFASRFYRLRYLEQLEGRE